MTRLSESLGVYGTSDESSSDLATNGTEGYYLSPHALGKEV